ncbi:hypothetical protein [Pseudarthrobacter enclensis]|uniref:Uncharacterized protein n=1 Tax=Pseudarthrobacter enclensis TaxID=993070 RepID=A0ABT9RNY1_9MICC|nr:hypothetical protein [Pseudarthrobacter enclensis]MDP9886936.1 hypothetical protein [Pseudarthrobacter enclensis]
MNSEATIETQRAASDLEHDGTDAGKTDKPLGLRVDWARLPGHSVEVWLQGERVARGVVDQAAEDNSVLWIAAEGISTRRIFDKSSGYQVWL